MGACASVVGIIVAEVAAVEIRHRVEISHTRKRQAMAKWEGFVQRCADSYLAKPSPAKLARLQTHITEHVPTADSAKALKLFINRIMDSQVSHVGSTVGSVAASQVAESTVAAASTVVDDDSDVVDFDRLDDDNDDDDETDEGEYDDRDAFDRAFEARAVKHEDYVAEIQRRQDANRRGRHAGVVIRDDDEQAFIDRQTAHTRRLVDSKRAKLAEVSAVLRDGGTTKKETQRLHTWRTRLEKEIKNLAEQL